MAPGCPLRRREKLSRTRRRFHTPEKDCGSGSSGSTEKLQGSDLQCWVGSLRSPRWYRRRSLGPRSSTTHRFQKLPANRSRRLRNSMQKMSLALGSVLRRVWSWFVSLDWGERKNEQGNATRRGFYPILSNSARVAFRLRRPTTELAHALT